jgi:hypothetical protein
VFCEKQCCGEQLAAVENTVRAVDRLDRDVLGQSKLTDVIWLEEINDLGGKRRLTPIVRSRSCLNTFILTTPGAFEPDQQLTEGALHQLGSTDAGDC